MRIALESKKLDVASGQGTSQAEFDRDRRTAKRNSGGGGDFENLHPRASGGKFAKANSSQNLERGLGGGRVSAAQEQLSALGYDLGPHGIDGKLGPDTEQAIRDFQEENGLEEDGVIGPLTAAAMQARTYAARALGTSADRKAKTSKAKKSGGADKPDPAPGRTPGGGAAVEAFEDGSALYDDGQVYDPSIPGFRKPRKSHPEDDLETKLRYVRTPAGARKYRSPIGTPITPALVRAAKLRSTLTGRDRPKPSVIRGWTDPERPGVESALTRGPDLDLNAPGVADGTGSAIYRTMYASHEDERVELLGQVGETSTRVRFEDGTEELVPTGTLLDIETNPPSGEAGEDFIDVGELANLLRATDLPQEERDARLGRAIEFNAGLSKRRSEPPPLTAGERVRFTGVGKLQGNGGSRFATVIRGPNDRGIVSLNTGDMIRANQLERIETDAPGIPEAFDSPGQAINRQERFLAENSAAPKVTPDLPSAAGNLSPENERLIRKRKSAVKFYAKKDGDSAEVAAAKADAYDVAARQAAEAGAPIPSIKDGRTGKLPGAPGEAGDAGAAAPPKSPHPGAAGNVHAWRDKPAGKWFIDASTHGT